MTKDEKDKLSEQIRQIREAVNLKCPPDCEDCAQEREEDEAERADRESELRANSAFGRLVERGVFRPVDDYEPWDDVYAGTAQEYDGD